jgi:hypothetical protein
MTKPSNERPVRHRAYLEVREADGSASFYSIDDVLKPRGLQQRCLEKALLQRIKNLKAKNLFGR